MKPNRYLADAPCQHGHVAERYRSNDECCECSSIKSKKYRSDKREKIKKYDAERRAANPGYRAPNKTLSNLAYYERHKEKCGLRSKAHRAKNMGKYAVYSRCRRAKLASAPGTHTLQDIVEIFKMQKGQCAYCKTKVSMKSKRVDHIHPLARGGHNGRSNLQILCEPCNVRKSDIEPIVFARRIGRLI